MEVSRSWSRRGGEKSEAGVVGSAVLTAPDGDWLLDGKPLPAVSVARLLDQALSPLTDSFAGCFAIADAVTEFNDTKQALWDGTSGSRGSGGVDPVTAEIRLITGAKIREADKGRPGAERWPAMRDAKAADRNKDLDESFARQKPKVRAAIEAAAQAAVERKAAEAAARKAAAEAVPTNGTDF